MIETLVRRTIDTRWRFTQSGTALLYLQNGLERLPALFGVADMNESRIVDYIVYQVYRCRQSVADGSWQYTWLFSQAAMEKFRRQFLSAEGKSGMNYYIDQWLDEAELSRGKLESLIAKPKDTPLRGMVYMASEEPIKRRFLNTEDGFALCQRSTTGWSPLSAACGQCDKRAACEQMTANKYPELVRFRKESYGKQEK